MPDNNGHGNGSFIHGTPMDEPVDLAAVQADDELINALAAGMGVPSAGRAFHADDQVVALLSSWRADVVAEPIPELIDLETAVAAVKAGTPSARPVRSARVRHLVPVAAAAAFLVLVGGGVTIGSATAQPDSALWPMSKVLFSERAESVEAAVRASDKIENAKQALAEGKPEQASADLAQAQQDLSKVRPQEGKDELVGVKDFLTAKAAETPSGTKVDPASPLKADRRRPIPAGAAMSQQPTTAGTLSPDPTSGEANDPAPTMSTRPSHSSRPPTRQRPPATTDAPDAPVAPELSTGEAGAATTSAPVTATREGKPDTTSTTTTNSGMGSTRRSPGGGGSSEESAPRTTS
jgi:Anti-sigma-D factor RsdA to sigma factor binding region